MPKLSVVITTHNRCNILMQRALPSILRQTYGDLECIVVDDGSVDYTEKLVREAGNNDARIRYVRKENGGPSSARNLGIKESKGEYIAFTDDDDEFFPEYMEAALGELDACPYIDFLSGMAINVGPHKKSYHTPQLEPFWKYSVGNGWIFRKSVFDDILFDENLFGTEDMDLLIRLSLAGKKGRVFMSPLRIYHMDVGQHVSDSTANDFERFLRKHEKFYKEQGPEALSWLYFMGASAYLHAGNKRTARHYLLKSFRIKPCFSLIPYILSSFGGYNFFRRVKRKILDYLP